MPAQDGWGYGQAEILPWETLAGRAGCWDRRQATIFSVIADDSHKVMVVGVAIN